MTRPHCSNQIRHGGCSQWSLASCQDLLLTLCQCHQSSTYPFEVQVVAVCRRKECSTAVTAQMYKIGPFDLAERTPERTQLWPSPIHCLGKLSTPCILPVGASHWTCLCSNSASSNKRPIKQTRQHTTRNVLGQFHFVCFSIQVSSKPSAQLNSTTAPDSFHIWEDACYKIPAHATLLAKKVCLLAFVWS